MTSLPIPKRKPLKPDNTKPEAGEADAKAEPVGSLKMKEDEKLYPVGNSIVFTKTTFFVDDNKDDDKTNNVEEGSDEFWRDRIPGRVVGQLAGDRLQLGRWRRRQEEEGPSCRFDDG